MYKRGKFKTKEEMEEAKKGIIKELAKLENMKWTADSEIAATIFPYVLIEAINLLRNSEIISNPKDYTSTGADAKNMIIEIIKGKIVE